MTCIEAFTQAKDKGNPASNEDRLVIVSDRLYAVIDGATDKSGQTHDGLTGGQIAGRILEEVLRNEDAPRNENALRNAARDLGREGAGEITASTILDAVSRGLRRQYRLHGIADAIRREPWRGFAAQATIAVREGRHYRFIVVGDTGLRINGREIFFDRKPGDLICAQLRAAVYRHMAGTGAGGETADKWARAYTVDGLKTVLPGTPRALSDADLVQLREAAREECGRLLPDIAEEIVEAVLIEGLKGAYRYHNAPGPLGFPCIDGSPVPRDMIVEFKRPAKSIHCIELFSDGYPGVPERTALGDWEALHTKAEHDDPGRISTYPDTKGSAPGRFADDRTILIVRPSSEGD